MRDTGNHDHRRRCPHGSGERVARYDLLGRRDTDYYAVFADIPDADRAVWDTAKAFADEVGTRMQGEWDAASYPIDLVQRMGELELFTDGIEHPELPYTSPLAAGLVNMEISRHDGSLATALAVQGGLALRDARVLRLARAAGAVAEAPRRRHRARRLRADRARPRIRLRLARDHGDPHRRRLVAQRHEEVDRQRCLRRHHLRLGPRRERGRRRPRQRSLLPRRAGHPGLHGTVITGKVSLRGIHQAHIAMDGVRLPADAVLPGTHTFKTRRSCCSPPARVWLVGALGHATACYEIARTYATERMQFGKPLAKFQMVQERLAQMLDELTAMQLYCRRLADLESSGGLRPTRRRSRSTTTPAPRAGSRRSPATCSAGNGLLENGVMQHMADIEAIHTYEGTESVQALLLGRDITGMSAFV